MVNKLTGRYRSSHEVYFRQFCAARRGSGCMPVGEAEMFATDRLFLEVVERIDSFTG